MMKAILKAELLKMFDESAYPKVEAAIEATGATHLVCFENLALDSSSLGERTVLCVGPTCTFKRPKDCEGKWLKDLPSQRQYPVAYAPVDPVVSAGGDGI